MTGQTELSTELSTELIVKTCGLCRWYQTGGSTVRALDSFDCEISAGEFTVLAGPSGSGKTTLLNLVGAMDRPSSGTLSVAGINIAGLTGNQAAEFRADYLGFVFQQYNLIPVLSVFENVQLGLKLSSIGAQLSAVQQRQRIEEILSEVGLADLSERRPGQLSGGQQQRVAVARALVKRPRLVLADEPTANLDSATGEGIMNLMTELNVRHKITFLFSSHDPLVINFGRRVIRLRDGRIDLDTD